MLSYLPYSVWICMALLVWLYFSNVPEEERYMQYSVVPVFVLTGILLLSLFYKFSAFASAHLTGLAPFWAEMLYSLLSLILMKLTKGYLLRDKMKLNLARFLQSLFDLPSAERLYWGFRRNKRGQIVLRQGWKYLKILSLLSGIILLFSLVLSVIFYTSLDVYKVPGLLFLPAAILFELFYYLNGPEDNELVVTGEEPGYGKFLDYRKLWEKYQEIWNSMFSLASFTGIKTGNMQISVEQILEQISRDLEEGKDVIIADGILEKSFAAIVPHMQKKIARGANILILCDVPERFSIKKNREEKLLTELFTDWINSRINAVARGNGRSLSAVYLTNGNLENAFSNRVLLATAEFLLSRRFIPGEWFRNIDLVIYFNFSDALHSNLSQNQIASKLIARFSPDYQTIFFTDYCQGLQQAFEFNWEVVKGAVERRIIEDVPANGNYFIFWNEEDSRNYLGRIYRGFTDMFIGSLAVLPLLALKRQFSNINIIDAKMYPILDYVEETYNQQRGMIEEFRGFNVPLDDYNIAFISGILEEHDEDVFFIKDIFNHPVRTLQKWRPFSNRVNLLNIVSTPFILRDYIIDNFLFYDINTVGNISPQLSRCRINDALFLLHYLLSQEITERELLAIIRKGNPNASENALDELQTLCRQNLGIEINTGNYLNIKQSYDFTGNKFHEVFHYSINNSILEAVELNFLSKVNIRDNNNNDLCLLDYDHLFQNYLPSQSHSFNGKLFEIKNYDSVNRVLNVEFRNPIQSLFYRSDYRLTLEDVNFYLEEQKRVKTGTSVNKDSDPALLLQLGEAHFSVHTKGYFEFVNAYSIVNTPDITNVRYSPVSVPIRKYNSGRFLKISVNNIDGSCEVENITKSMVLLLKEASYTFFPEFAQYLIITGEYELLENDKRLAFSLAEFEFPKNNSREKNDAKEKGVHLYIFEDSYQDLGLVNAIYNNWELVFDILSDYLHWLTENITGNEMDKLYEHVTTLTKGDYRKKPCNRSAHLQYGTESYPSFFDPGNVLTFLKKHIPFNDSVYFKRSLFYKKGTTVATEEQIHQCDICGKEYPFYSLETLDDSRERCASCKASAIETLEALRGVFGEVDTVFREKLKVNVNVDIELQFANSHTINELAGSHFIPTSKFDPRTVGLAISENGKYKILIENASTRIKTLATVAHELTHIWQYSNLNIDRLKADTDNLLMEGHAEWTAVKVLELIDQEEEAKNYNNNTLARDDVYGYGLKEIYRICGNDAFGYLKSNYGK